MLSLVYKTPVRILQQQINSREFSELIAFNRIYPFLHDREETQLAILNAMVKSALTGKQATPGEFLPGGEKSNKMSDPAEIQAYFKERFTRGAN